MKCENKEYHFIIGDENKEFILQENENPLFQHLFLDSCDCDREMKYEQISVLHFGLILHFCMTIVFNKYFR